MGTLIFREGTRMKPIQEEKQADSGRLGMTAFMGAVPQLVQRLFMF